MAELLKSNTDSLVGRLVVEQGLASHQEVQDCLALRDQMGEQASGTSLADLLVTNGIVTRKQIERLRPVIEEQRTQQQIPGYEITKKLGAGAMATVYLARQLSLDRLVAIKILPRKFTNNPEFIERLYAEGRAVGRLNHPNIVGALDVGKAGDVHYFVMEYVEGHTVYDDIASGKKYTEAEALNIVIQVARALEHAHKAGFIHRDVKPKNIMITKEGIAKLADMGLARAISDREAAENEQGKAYGTPYYISPEQIRGEKDVDFRADIYSLGATFYHIVTGQVPFEGPNPSAVMHKHLNVELVPPDHLNPSLSAGIGEIIEVCMAKDRERRYRSTSDLLEDLESVAKGEPPLQARTKFDLSSLTALEPAPAPAGTPDGPIPEAPTLTLFHQPLFWVAVVGWGVSLVLLVLLAVIASTR
jgi:serine/threonine-protein kinase